MPLMTLSLAEKCIRRIKAKATEMRLEMAIAWPMKQKASRLCLDDAVERELRRQACYCKSQNWVAYRSTTRESLEPYAGSPANKYIVTMSAMCPGEFCVVPGGCSVGH
jgi:hypothetical protein